MTKPREKTVQQSSTEQVHIVLPAHCNGCGRLFGGQLMQWIDIVAAVCARRHSETNVVTVCVDNLIFHAPAFVDQVVVLHADITFVGNTSMEVRVDSFVEDTKGVRTLINRAYSVLVALDGDGQPKSVPAIIPKTKAQEQEYAGALERDRLRKSRRA